MLPLHAMPLIAILMQASVASEVAALIPVIVREAVGDTVGKTGSLTHRTPVIMDFGSFSERIYVGTGVRVDSARIASLVPHNYRDAKMEEAIVSSSRAGSRIRDFSVIDGATYVRLEWLTPTEGGYHAVIATYATDRRGSRSTLCSRTLGMELKPTNGTVEVKHLGPLAIC